MNKISLIYLYTIVGSHFLILFMSFEHEIEQKQEQGQGQGQGQEQGNWR